MTDSLLDLFEEAFECARKREPGIEMVLDREEGEIQFSVPRLEETGFDVGAVVWPRGFVPWAGEWHGMMRDATGRPDEDRDKCREFFALVRTLLSPAGRLRYRYRRDKLVSAALELHSPSAGWSRFESVGFFVLPTGRVREEFVCNRHLPVKEWPGDSYDW